MRYDDITPSMRAFLGNREMVRRLGFDADDIYMLTAQSARHGGALSLFLTIRAQGLEFNIECGTIESVKGAEAEYQRVIDAMADGSLSDDDYFRMFEASEAYRFTAALVASLQGRGFEVTIPSPPRAQS